MNQEKINVVILAAGKLPNQYWPKRYKENPIWFSNFGNNSILHIISSKYDKARYKLNVVYDEKNKNYNFEKFESFKNINNFINIEKTNSIIETIFKSLNLFKNDEKIIFQVISLIPDNQNEDTFYKSFLIDISKNHAQNGSWESIKEKESSIEQYALAGRLLTTKKDLIDFFEKYNFKKDEKLNILAKFLLNEKGYKFNNINWIDIGHIETFNQSRIN